MFDPALIAAVLGSLLTAAPLPIEARFEHSLSASDGVLPISGANLAWEPVRDELFATSAGLVRIFNAQGMQVFEFGEEPEVGGILSVGPLAHGDLIALSNFDDGLRLLRLNFRGELLGRIPYTLPAVVGAFTPSILRIADGQLYLCDTQTMKAVVLDTQGAFVTWYDLGALLKVEDVETTGIRGFNIDDAGNLLVTVQPMFSAFVVSPTRTVRAFGVPGSTPGKFNVVGGIASDARGNLYVTDILRAAVMVFDRDFNFLREFGYRGARPQNLLGPEELVVAQDRLYVANGGRRGVSVFTMESKEP